MSDLNLEEKSPVEPSEQRYMSTAQVAVALGVSVTTVKRWVDDNILPAYRTAGGHRKLRYSEVLFAIRNGNLPVSDMGSLVQSLEGNKVTDPLKLRSELQEAIKHQEFELIRTILHRTYQSGISFATLADQVLAPAMTVLGHQWETGKIDVLFEHRITQACVGALYELQASVRTNQYESDCPVAVGGAPEHDHYILPSLLAKLTLLECGWNAINLGPHTPFFAFKAALEELRPQLVCISVSHVHDVDIFLKEYTEFFHLAEQAGVAVAVGGFGLVESIRSKMPYTTFGDGMMQLASFSKSLHRRPQRPKRGRPSKSGDFN